MSVETTVIIPARNELFLNQTLQDVAEKSTDACEVIAVLDGYWPEDIYRHDKVSYIHFGEQRGMRPALNAGVAAAKGAHVMKLDAHCMVSEGFDQVLVDTCHEDWVCVPTRKRLDAEHWCVRDDGRPDINYQFIDISNDGLNGKEWRQKNQDRSLDAVRVDDIISCQGSCYFMHKAHWEAMGLLDEAHYGSFRKDPQEVMFKTWTSGGRCVRVKDAWYAHLHKGRKWGRMYSLDRADYHQGDEFVKQWWTDSAWDERQTIPLRDIFRRFPDMPGWADHPWMQGEPIEMDPPESVGMAPLHDTLETRAELAAWFARQGFTNGALIGVDRGGYAQTLFEAIPDLHLACIDPWSPRRPVSERHQRTIERLAPWDATIWRADPAEIQPTFIKAAFDFIYLDENHSFDAVMGQLLSWRENLRPGGVMAGHDYHMDSVRTAVDAYAAAHGHEVRTTDDRHPSWYWRTDAD